MANRTDIRNAIQNISRVWENPEARNGRYGNALSSISINGIRGFTETIRFEWPVTVIAGTNGSGKSTVLQLCSAAYIRPGSGRPYKIGDWLRNVLRGDSSLFDPTATIDYEFLDGTPGYRIPYLPQSRRWGYRRRSVPERFLVHVGIIAFAPRIDHKNLMAPFQSTNLGRGDVNRYTTETLQRLTKVLNNSYDGGSAHQVQYGRGGSRQEFLQQISRHNASYSETNMGAGEQKVARMIDMIERLGDRSTILLEEPETTLHGDAQRGLAWYLMDVTYRKGHQVIIASHSAEIYETVPLQARVMLVRDSTGVHPYYNVPYLQAARELNKDVRANPFLILVEDVVGLTMLSEVLKRYDRTLLNSSTIVPVGNTDDVRRMTQSMRGDHVHAVGVRDPDIQGNEVDGLFSLPGNMLPEAILLHDDNIQAAGRYIDDLQPALDRASVGVANLNGAKKFKRMFELFADESEMPKEELADRLTLAWIDTNEDAARTLARRLHEMLERD